MEIIAEAVATEDDQTAFTAFEKAGVTLKGREHGSLGLFVTQIGDRKPPEGQFFKLLVKSGENWVMSDRGVSTKLLHEGQRVCFVLDTPH